jgi:hypothetical protein
VVTQVINDYRVRCFVPGLLRVECCRRWMAAPTGPGPADPSTAADRSDWVLLPAALLVCVVVVRHA